MNTLTKPGLRDTLIQAADALIAEKRKAMGWEHFARDTLADIVRIRREEFRSGLLCGLGIAVLAVAVLVLAGCERAITVQSPPHAPETRSVSCTHVGYCYTCMPGFDGKTKCGFKMSAICPGTQDARVRVTPTDSYWKDGTHRTGESVEVLERTGACV